MELGKSLECERLSGKTQPRDGYISSQDVSGQDGGHFYPWTQVQLQGGEVLEDKGIGQEQAGRA